jgi:uncharacterized protein (TIGR02271 family)
MARTPLSQLDDWELVNEDQDLRGMPVQDQEGNRIGTVKEMIVDTDTEYVDMIVLDDGSEYPAGDVEARQGVVQLRGIGTEAAERTRPTGRVEGEGEIERIPRYEEELQAEKTEREAGAVRIGKDVVEEEQTLDVPVTREEVRVRRRAVDRPAADTSEAFRRDAIEVPVREEDVEVRKEPRVAEELEISKDARQDTERVSGTVRRERVDIQQEGDVDVERDTEPDAGGR